MLEQKGSYMQWVDLKISIINIRKSGRFLSNLGQVQPHFHSKAWQLSTQLLSGLLTRIPKNSVLGCRKVVFKGLGDIPAF